MATWSLHKVRKFGVWWEDIGRFIKSLYVNDSLRFLINGKYSDPLWLLRGVKQGIVLNLPKIVSQQQNSSRL